MFRNKLRDEDGQVMVMAFLSMTLLLAFVALAVDVGALFNARRSVQTAADAAAVAAALDFFYHGSSSKAVSAASSAATGNGITPGNTVAANTACTDLTKNCLEVFFGTSITNAYHKTSGYQEAIVSQPNPTFFMGLLGFKNLPVAAKAVAGTVPSSPCIQATAPTRPKSLWVKGNGNIFTPHCGIQINSTSPDAFCDQGSGTIEAPYVNVAGGQSTSGMCAKKSGSPVFSGTGQAPDPFGGMTGPNPATDCTGANTVTASTVTTAIAAALPKSTVTKGSTTAQVTCFSATNVLTNSGVTLGSSPSTNGQIFVFENGVQLPGNSGTTLTVNGTMDISQGTLNQGNTSLTINAPGSDNAASAKSLSYNALALMQPASNTTAQCQDNSAKDALLTFSEPCLQVQFGTGLGSLHGYIYAPTSMVYMQDQGGAAQVAGIISYSLYVNSQLNISNYSAVNNASTPLSQVQLVE